MNINQQQENGKLVLALEGKLDATTAPRLQEVLIPALEETKQVELDFAKITYISSAGLRVLITGHKLAGSKGVEMTLCKVSEKIMKMFDMTGFSSVLTIVQA